MVLVVAAMVTAVAAAPDTPDTAPVDRQVMPLTEMCR